MEHPAHPACTGRAEVWSVAGSALKPAGARARAPMVGCRPNSGSLSLCQAMESAPLRGRRRECSEGVRRGQHRWQAGLGNPLRDHTARLPRHPTPPHPHLRYRLSRQQLNSVPADASTRCFSASTAGCQAAGASVAPLYVYCFRGRGDDSGVADEEGGWARRAGRECRRHAPVARLQAASTVRPGALGSAGGT